MTTIIISNEKDRAKTRSRWIWAGSTALAALALGGMLVLYPHKPTQETPVSSEQIALELGIEPGVSSSAEPVQNLLQSSECPSPPLRASPPPPAETMQEDTSTIWLEKAGKALAQDDLNLARTSALRALELAQNQVNRDKAMGILGSVNPKLVFNQRPMPEKFDYFVQSGDTLDRLARRFYVPLDLLMKMNGLKGSVIRLGQRLRILSGQFSILIDKSDNTLTLFHNDLFFKQYRVGTGKHGNTPDGDFSITAKVAQPPWTRPEDGIVLPYGDTNNVLGTHWMSINFPGFGIHGTWDNQTVGYASSAGCVRLINEEVEELFTLVPEGTPVRITE